ncbi:MAG: thioredoxin family protein [Ktedonobacteraceae bacterium]|nr:thioredoxin family protein [Ktedonobacteraceae bacterium]
MADTIVRLVILLLLVAALWLLVRAGRAFVNRQRQLALAASAPDNLSAPAGGASSGSERVHILAFSSAGCRQCHTLQAPALQRLMRERGPEVAVIHVDAANEPDLARRYHILTVPATVVLDAGGQVSAVNYGFASTQQLSEQVDAALDKSAPVGQRL